MYDVSNLKKLSALGAGAAEAWEGFLAFDKAAFTEGAPNPLHARC